MEFRDIDKEALVAQPFSEHLCDLAQTLHSQEIALSWFADYFCMDAEENDDDDTAHNVILWELLMALRKSIHTLRKVAIVADANGTAHVMNDAYKAYVEELRSKEKTPSPTT